MKKRLYFTPEELVRLKRTLEKLELFLGGPGEPVLSLFELRSRLSEMNTALNAASHTRQMLAELLHLTGDYPVDPGSAERSRRIIGRLYQMYELENVRFRQLENK